MSEQNANGPNIAGPNTTSTSIIELVLVTNPQRRVRK